MRAWLYRPHLISDHRGHRLVSRSLGLTSSGVHAFRFGERVTNVWVAYRGLMYKCFHNAAAGAPGI